MAGLLPQFETKLEGAGPGGDQLPGACLVPSGAPDLVVPVAEAWDGGQDEQVVCRRVLCRVLNLQASSTERMLP